MVRAEEVTVAQLGLLEFLEATPGPACIIRCTVDEDSTDAAENNASTEEDSQEDVGVTIAWSNDLMTSRLRESAEHAVSRARATSTDGLEGGNRYKAMDVPVESEPESRLRWRCVPLRNGTYWALTGTEDPPPSTSSSSTETRLVFPSRASSSSIPTTETTTKVSAYEPEVGNVYVEDVPLGRLDWLSVTGRTPESKAFIELFKNMDWEKTRLGRPSAWSTSLVTMVNVCLSSPFPVLLSWGSDKVLLYNEQYSKVIGGRHPEILGMPYDEAWPEVWDALGPVVDSAYAGNIVHVEDQEMFLKRKDLLEETFFTWSMIPLRGVSGTVEGLFIPNFDRSNAVITNRRLAGLHEISRHIATGTSPDLVMEAALRGLAQNSRDVGFVLLYTTDRDSIEEFSRETSDAQSFVKTAGTDCGSVAYGSAVAAEDIVVGEEESEIALTLAGAMGAIDLEGSGSQLPRTLTSHRLQAVDECDQSKLTDIIRLAHIRDELVLMRDDEMDAFEGCLKPNVFGDIPQQAAVIPIKASAEDRCHGILVVGLSTRLFFDDSYSNYLALVRTLLANGRAAAELHLEEKLRAEYLAAINRQKARELEVALDRKTQELKEAELKFTSAFDISPAGIWISSADGRVEFGNQVYRRWSGLESTGSLEKWIDMVHPDDKKEVHDQFVLCLKQLVKAEFRFLTGETNEAGEPEVRWIEATGKPAFGPGINPDTGEREVLFVTGALIDVTLRKKNEAFQAQRADDNLAMRHQLEDYVDFISHEQRTPIFGMGMAIQSLIDRLKSLRGLSMTQQAEIEDALQDANIITLCISHMQRLADDILLLSKLDRDMLVMTPAPCRPIQIVKNVAEMIIAPERDVEYALDITSRYNELVDWVNVDPQRVAQTVINLVNNAIKFTRNRPVRRINIRLDASLSKPPVDVGDFVDEDGIRSTPKELSGESSVFIICSVQDTGIGIEPDEAKKLFRRFQQTLKTSVTYGGSGLGLFLCKRITQKLGGDITLQTEYGKGSTFTFYVEAERCEPPPSDPKVSSVPLVDRVTDSEQAVLHDLRNDSTTPLPDSSQATLDRAAEDILDTPKTLISPNAEQQEEAIHILLAEDNIINQKLLQRQLVKAGYKVSVANNGVEALEHLHTTPLPLHCILMDIEMPKMGGIECTGEIRKMEAEQTKAQRIPIIAVTANARTAQIQEMLDSGFDDAIAKPFAIKALITKINNLARSYRTA